jgi:hypothetical protein
VGIGHFILNNFPSQKALAKNIRLRPSMRLHQHFAALFLNEVTARGPLFAAELGPYIEDGQMAVEFTTVIADPIVNLIYD